MRQINLLPEPTFVEKHKKLIGTLIAWVLVCISIYWLFPYCSRAFHTYLVSTQNSNAGVVLIGAKHSIHKLQIIGYLSREQHDSSQEYWSILQAPDKSIFTVKVGDHLGYEAAQVTDIKPIGISLKILGKKEPILIRANQLTHA